MTIANCKRCDRMYNRVRRDICLNCIADEDKAFQAVRTYLREHRNASMANVVENTGVELDLVVDMIRDGRIILRDNPNLTYECERCGKSTQSGRYCTNCTQELAANLSGAAAELRKQRDMEQQGKSGYFSKP